MKKYHAYIRVSTIKQGEKGSSLTEQRDAIVRYAERHSLPIATWYEEQETAAKRGRTIFRRMMAELKRGNASGLILHKIDRGARNLADWAELAALMDLGIEVHFAHETIDMQTRGGRLSADIQAVVAADYIRNLRQEVKKGIDGRLKQGLYPFKAPVGYRDNGGGAVKTICPVQGPLVRLAFETYADTDHSIRTLLPYMTSLGLSATSGQPLSLPAFGKLLQNEFYFGLIRIKGRVHPGIHEPLITKDLFDRVRAKAEGRTSVPETDKIRIAFTLRGLVRCARCNRHLYGERQKGRTYYRCQTKTCRGTCVREDALIESFITPLSFLDLVPSFSRLLGSKIEEVQADKQKVTDDLVASLRLRLGQIDVKLARLTDLYLGNGIDEDEYHAKRAAFIADKTGLLAEVERAQSGARSAKVPEFLELLKALGTMRESGEFAKASRLVRKVVSNWSVNQKDIDIDWSKSMSMLIDLAGVSNCAPGETRTRTH